jgi:hypothetical protein
MSMAYSETNLIYAENIAKNNKSPRENLKYILTNLKFLRQ